MRTGLAACTALLFLTASLIAQASPPDLTGRWRLVEPTAAERAQDTFAITSPDELLLTQTPLALIVEHPSKSGTHPAAGVFKYGVSGTVSGRIGAGPAETTTTITHIGTALVISHSATAPADVRGVRVTVGHGSTWRLEGSNVLVIEFTEQRAGQPPGIANRSYMKIQTP